MVPFVGSASLTIFSRLLTGDSPAKACSNVIYRGEAFEGPDRQVSLRPSRGAQNSHTASNEILDSSPLCMTVLTSYTRSDPTTPVASYVVLDLSRLCKSTTLHEIQEVPVDGSLSDPPMGTSLACATTPPWTVKQARPSLHGRRMYGVQSQPWP